MSDKNKEFLNKLHKLLKEYNASIGFTCSDCSDTYGLCGDHMEVVIDKETVFTEQSWRIDAQSFGGE